MAIQSLEKSIDVVGIGNAIVDVLVQVDDSFLKKHSLAKGNMHLIDEKQSKNLYSEIKKPLESSGGSAANTLAGLAELGTRTEFIGRVRDDKLGRSFTNDIKATGASFNTPPAKSGASTAHCLVFITPDAQRTMCTYLGASISLEPEDLDLSIIEKSMYLYLEGYLWDSPAAKAAFIKAAETCKNNNGKIALSLSDSFCVERHRESFINLVDDYVDILFANEEEIICLYKTNNLSSAIKALKGRCETAVVTRGAKGSLIVREDSEINIQPYALGQLKDTTGAGDLYAAGFLYGLINRKDYKTCGEIGSICAGQIITQLGPRSDLPLKNLIQKYF